MNQPLKGIIQYLWSGNPESTKCNAQSHADDRHLIPVDKDFTPVQRDQTEMAARFGTVFIIGTQRKCNEKSDKVLEYSRQLGIGKAPFTIQDIAA